MKKFSLLCLCVIMLGGCEYTEQQRQQFYETCIQELQDRKKNVLDDIVISCACEKWSQREDIKPKNKEKRFEQYSEEWQTCRSEPIKMNYSQRKYFLSTCKQIFTETYYSMAEQMRMVGVSAYDIAGIGMYNPGFYKRSSNKELVDCACTRLSTRDDFIIPRTFETFEQEYKKEANECKKIWKSK